MAHKFSYPEAYGILISLLGMEPVSPELEGGFLTTGPPGKSPPTPCGFYEDYMS